MKQDERTQRVRALLLRNWDPLDVSDNPHLSNEYDRYIPGILRLLDSHCSIEQMERHLARMETEEMRLELIPEETARAARAVITGWADESR
ncbi:MAG TPA: hypothetical protein VEQ35_05645 [Beijerinckia sp.]|jgi:hypothetical protein|nr:hypothetical protein [Beijerinckia sp.]